MPTLPPGSFADRVRDLTSDELAAFCAALWRERGWETDRRSDGAVAVERGGERGVLAPVPAGWRARIAGSAAVPADATVVVAPGRRPGGVPDAADVLDAHDLYAFSLYGLPRERADEVLRTHLGVAPTVPPGFDETARDRLRAALVDLSASPAVRTVAVLAFVAALVLAGASAHPDVGGEAPDSGPDTDAVSATAALKLPPDRSTGLGNSPGQWSAGSRIPTESDDERNVAIGPDIHFDSPVLAATAGANGSVYVGLFAGFVYALQPSGDGRALVRWQLYFERGLAVGPTARGDAVYVGTDADLVSDAASRAEGRHVYAIEAGSGEIRWEYPTPAAASSLGAPAPEGTLFVGDRAGTVHALNATTGRARWRTSLGGPVFLSGATVDGTIHAATANGAVIALDASTGVSAWNRSLDAGSGFGSAPAVGDGRLYLGTERGSVLALDAATGETVWNRSVGSAVQSTPAVAGGRAYVGTRNGSVYALNATTGAVVWRRSAGGPVFASPVVDGGTAYVGVAGEPESLVALDSATGDRERRFDTAGAVFSAPAVTSGLVVAGDYAGHVYLLERDRGRSAVVDRYLAHRRGACGESGCGSGNRSTAATGRGGAGPPATLGGASADAVGNGRQVASAAGAGSDGRPDRRAERETEAGAAQSSVSETLETTVDSTSVAATASSASVTNQ